MEFNIFEHFKGMGMTSNQPTNHYEQGGKLLLQRASRCSCSGSTR